ncbi:MAG: hypothetical protein IPM37_12905 [Hahellaceae bacterium]|nr:hypothetical protein [Hahellaceae bacterium]
MPSKNVLTLVLGVLLGSLAHPAAAVSKDKPPERANDPAYGAALFQYYQGDSFQALTELSVAEARGGIKGHGDHPALLRGGMMLAYGMTRSAKGVFQDLLKQDADPETHNLAWFYLAKVFYLERDFSSATDSLSRVVLESLSADRPELYDEALYLKGQIALALNDEPKFQEILAQLPENSVWRPYLQYNHAIQPASAGVLKETIARLQAIELSEDSPLPENERLALQDRMNLTLASFYLDDNENGAAMATFQKVRLEGPLSDQALFGYALACANQNEFGLSLQALLTLSERPLFNPWVQQVPYALGYLYEKLDSREQALNAYTQASNAYVTLKNDLDGMIEHMDEAAILSALQLDVEKSAAVVMGADGVPVDSYGRIKIKPANFNLAQRIASEAFQMGLRDLHELYRIRSFFKDWNTRLNAAEMILATRENQFQASQKEAHQQLVAQPQDVLSDQVARVRQQIDSAVAQENTDFFMSETQLDAQAFIQSVRRKVDALADPSLRQEFDVKLKRIEAYFTWWVADTYGVNRWQAQKPLQALSRELDAYVSRRERVEGWVSDAKDNQTFAGRIQSLRSQVEGLSAGLEEQIGVAQRRLIDLVRQDLTRQRKEVMGYLVATKEARARLLDEKYRSQSLARPEAEPVSQEGAVQ